MVITRWHIDASALLLPPLVWWKSTDRDIPKGKAVNWRPDLQTWTEDTFWIEGESEHVGKHLSSLWRQSSLWPISIVILTWLSPSWMVVSLCIDLAEKDLLLDITFRSFLGQEITENKKLEVPGSCILSSAGFWRWSMISSRNNGEEDWLRLIGTDKRGGVGLNGILKPSQTIGRTHLLFVNSHHCSTKWANPPTGISGRGKIGSGKSWLSELCGRWGMFRGGELFRVTTPL